MPPYVSYCNSISTNSIYDNCAVCRSDGGHLRLMASAAANNITQGPLTFFHSEFITVGYKSINVASVFYWPVQFVCLQRLNPLTPTVAIWIQPQLCQFLTSGHSDAQPWASVCPDVKNYKWRLNPVWHRMLYSCTDMATVGVKGLTAIVGCVLCAAWCYNNFVTALDLPRVFSALNQ